MRERAAVPRNTALERFTPHLGGHGARIEPELVDADVLAHTTRQGYIELVQVSGVFRVREAGVGRAEMAASDVKQVRGATELDVQRAARPGG